MSHNEITTTYRQKIQERVAIEFGYENEIVREVLRQKSFDCSGDLVDYLFLLNVEEIKHLRKAYYKSLDKEERLEKQCLEVKTHRVENEMEDMKLQSLQRETKLLYIKSKCLNCFINLRNIVTLPCSHLCLCECCSLKVDKCPSCQEAISCIIKTFHC